MDLLATVRKEGTRGGTGDFKWSDVQGSSHREHYLGHSLMAPVGRWQQNRDLNWYAKSDTIGDDGEDPEQRAARERKEEIKRIKEAEEDALARALGLPVPDRNNANMEALGDRKAVDRVLKDAKGQDENESGRGLGFGTGSTMPDANIGERIEGSAAAGDHEMQHALKEYKRRHGGSDTKHKVQSRDHDRSHHRHQERRHHRDVDRPRERHQDHRPRNSSRERYRRRSGSRLDDRDRRHRDRTRDRSRSPHRQKYSEERDRRRAQTDARPRD